MELIDRLNKYVKKKADGCWEWTGYYDKRPGFLPYGLITVKCEDGKFRPRVAHRVMYLEMVGPIPEGLHLDHLCRYPKCVNPEHLEPVSPKENTRRSPIVGVERGKQQMAKTHCPQGHPYSGDNLRLTYNAKGGQHRECRACHAAANRRRRAEAKARKG